MQVFANGLFFTPKPIFKDLGGFLDVAIFLVSVVFVFHLLTTGGKASFFCTNFSGIRFDSLSLQVQLLLFDNFAQDLLSNHLSRCGENLQKVVQRGVS